MAIMYPKSISEYMPTDSERIVYHELKNQLPDTFEVFYSVKWTNVEDGKLIKSEADFIVTSPEYGFLCLEVKGGSNIRIEDNVWYVGDDTHGERKLKRSPYDQAERSMYYFMQMFSNKFNMDYQGIFGAGAVFPFYSIGPDVMLDKRHRDCTIDSNDLNAIHSKIKSMFRLWKGKKYRWFYPSGQHKALMELIRERLAISAAAGALVKYKDQQLDVINRVQNGYVYFLKNMNRFYIRGGAGTGKTWIAMKMAEESYSQHQKTLFMCASPHLAKKVRTSLSQGIDVYDLASLLGQCVEGIDLLTPPFFAGAMEHLRDTYPHYDAIYVDEAQDFTEELAQFVNTLLVDTSSRLGVFYDDVQILRQDSFSNGFAIESRPYLLHENIRNTANIYNWTAEKTKLGTDVISNPVEGPMPVTEYITEKGQMTHRLETLFRKYLDDEYLPNTSLVLIVDDIEAFQSEYPDGIAKWNFVHREVAVDTEIQIASVAEYKGLETDMAVYIHSRNASENLNYIAYTRAKYYLIELVREYEWHR